MLAEIVEVVLMGKWAVGSSMGRGHAGAGRDVGRQGKGMWESL